jgi:hypothetical protein
MVWPAICEPLANAAVRLALAMGEVVQRGRTALFLRIPVNNTYCGAFHESSFERSAYRGKLSANLPADAKSPRAADKHGIRP